MLEMQKEKLKDLFEEIEAEIIISSGPTTSDRLVEIQESGQYKEETLEEIVDFLKKEFEL